MSLNGNRIGGQYFAKPLTTWEKVWVGIMITLGALTLLSPFIVAVIWWVWL